MRIEARCKQWLALLHFGEKITLVVHFMTARPIATGAFTSPQEMKGELAMWVPIASVVSVIYE